MKPIRLAIPALTSLISAVGISSCQDDVSTIGSSIVNGEVSISVDSLILGIDASTIDALNIDTRSTTTLLGNISATEYGRLSADYVTQLLAASSMAIPDSIGVERVDSMRMVLEIPRNATIGDTLAPQQLKIYRLSKALPADIKSNFDPQGYYDPDDVVATRNYTLSAIALSDSAFYNNRTLSIAFPLPKEWAVDAFNAYRKGSPIFDWPQDFNKSYPGIYVRSSFGRGALANVQATRLFLYYHYFITRNIVENEVSVEKRITMKDSVCLFASSPETIASSLLNYKPAQSVVDLVSNGKKIITTPTGYRVRLTFPAKEILQQYWAADHNLSVINNRTFALPATTVNNDYGILPPPELLMIRTSEIDDFFANGKVPDNKTSFRGTYSSTSGRYEFSSMRQYIVDLKNKGRDIAPEDVDFTLIPVNFTTESVTNSYDGSITVYVTGCSPYISSPRMAVIDTDHAVLVFTFTSQIVK